MNAEGISEHIHRLGAVRTLQSPGTVFFIYDAVGDLPDERLFPFATLVTDNSNDTVSDLDEPGTFRINVGLTKSEYRETFRHAPDPARRARRPGRRCRLRGAGRGPAAPALRLAQLGLCGEPCQKDVRRRSRDARTGTRFRRPKVRQPPRPRAHPRASGRRRARVVHFGLSGKLSVVCGGAHLPVTLPGPSTQDHALTDIRTRSRTKRIRELIRAAGSVERKNARWPVGVGRGKIVDAVPDRCPPKCPGEGQRSLMGGASLKIMSYSESRARYAETLACVTDDREEVIITRVGHEPVVMVPLDDYESLKETAYLLRSPENARRLWGAIERLERGAGGADG